MYLSRFNLVSVEDGKNMNEENLDFLECILAFDDKFADSLLKQEDWFNYVSEKTTMIINSLKELKKDAESWKEWVKKERERIFLPKKNK